MNLFLTALIYLVIALVIAILAIRWLKRIVIENDRKYHERMEAKRYKHVIDQWGRIPKAGDGKAVLLFIALVLLICLNN